MNQKSIPIFYEGQDDLVDILATSMVSICYNTKSFIDFYILDCGLCDFNKKMLESLKEKFDNFSIEFIPVDLTQFKGLKGWGPRADILDAYARLLIPDIKPELEKVIYLDSDVIALGDIQQLYDIDLEDYAYGATPELGYNKHLFNNCITNLGIKPEHIYPNAGMLLLNLKKIQSSDKLIEVCKKYNKNLIILNEEIFSITFGCNNYKRLDLRYNIADRLNLVHDTNAPEITDEYIENEWKHVVLQHLTPTKPWKFLRSETFMPSRNVDAFWMFAQMTPFYAGLQNKYIWFAIEQNSTRFHKIKAKFLGIFPLFSIKVK